MARGTADKLGAPFGGRTKTAAAAAGFRDIVSRIPL